MNKKAITKESIEAMISIETTFEQMLNFYTQFSKEELTIITQSLNGIMISGQMPLKRQFIINVSDMEENGVDPIIQKLEDMTKVQILQLVIDIHSYWSGPSYHYIEEQAAWIFESFNYGN